eukprot:1044336-Pyramimonas_sp.AAC.1
MPPASPSGSRSAPPMRTSEQILVYLSIPDGAAAGVAQAKRRVQEQAAHPPPESETGLPAALTDDFHAGDRFCGPRLGYASQPVSRPVSQPVSQPVARSPSHRGAD